MSDWLDDFLEDVWEEPRAEFNALLYIDSLLMRYNGTEEEKEIIYYKSNHYTKSEAEKIINYLKENQSIDDPVDRFKYYIKNHY
tara:strand:+ start:1312 stop:1563 length:252 start_codon:yes stop_codon:yes gene_type:complete